MLVSKASQKGRSVTCGRAQDALHFPVGASGRRLFTVDPTELQVSCDWARLRGDYIQILV